MPLPHSKRSAASLRLQPLLLLCLSCANPCSEEADAGGVSAIAPGEAAPLLSEAGALRAPSDGGTPRATYHLAVSAGQRLDVALQSAAFDPTLTVTMPSGEVLVNDDYLGDRNHSRLSLIVPQAGELKILVTSTDRSAQGAFQLDVTPTADSSGLLSLDQTREGEVGAGDPRLPDGRAYEQILVEGAAGAARVLRIHARGAIVPLAILRAPSGGVATASEPGVYPIAEPGLHQLQLIAPGQEPARYSLQLRQAASGVQVSSHRVHHQLPPQPGGEAVTIGQTVRGALPGAQPLPTGEPAQVYTLAASAGTRLHVTLKSESFDSYLMIVSPSGQVYENDDAGGSQDSIVETSLTETGDYRVIASAYREGMSGDFELVIDERRAQTVVAAPLDSSAAASGATQIEGALAAGDQTLGSGEWMDVHELSFTPGELVTIRAISSAFDTYLIVTGPGDERHENDDGPEGTHAQVQFQASAGAYRVVVTSYAAGESGSYTLRVTRGAGGAGNSAGSSGGTAPAEPAQPTIAAGDRVQGTLAAGDRTLQSGEFVDHFTRAFPVGQSVQLRLSSTQFDPYLIVRTPSGHQLDNDDLDSSTRGAGIDLPAAEAGDYAIMVTSYQPGEHGSYELSFGQGPSVPGAPSGGAGEGDGAQIYALFVGISDYPDGVGDLPECANDAIKLAQTFREQGLQEASRQVVLTDGQANQANVRAAMTRFAQEMGPDDVFLFFYSGHGGQTASSTDAREIDGKDEYLVLHDGRLLDDDLGAMFATLRSRVTITALDACYSGGFAKDIITQPGRVGFFSSEEDVLSAVASQFQAGGYLSHFMRLAVSGNADSAPADRVLTVGELSHFLYTQFGQQASDVQLQGAFQHLVIDRGAVSSDQVLWAYH